MDNKQHQKRNNHNKKADNSQLDNSRLDSSQLDSNPIGELDRELDQTIVRTQPEPAKSRKIHQFLIGAIALVVLVGGLVFASPTATLSDVQGNGIGNGMKAGVILTSLDDNAGLTARDFDIEMKQGTESSRALIWDFAAEDGDYVTVTANGVVVADNIMIKNKPVAIDIPIPSVVEVIGITDGGGGITYGVKFPGALENSAYFNAADEGSTNVYTLTVP